MSSQSVSVNTLDASKSQNSKIFSQEEYS